MRKKKRIGKFSASSVAWVHGNKDGTRWVQRNFRSLKHKLIDLFHDRSLNCQYLLSYHWQHLKTHVAFSPVHLVNNVSYASLHAMDLEKLLANDTITALCQTKMSSKHYCSNVTNNRNEIWKTVRQTSFQNLHLLITSLNVLSVYFYVSLVAVPTIWIFKNFVIRLLQIWQMSA